MDQLLYRYRWCQPLPPWCAERWLARTRSFQPNMSSLPPYRVPVRLQLSGPLKLPRLGHLDCENGAPMAGREEECISERFTRCVFVTFQNCPLGSVRLRPLPDDVFRVPRPYLWRLCKGQSGQCKNQRNENLQAFLRLFVSDHTAKRILEGATNSYYPFLAAKHPLKWKAVKRPALQTSNVLEPVMATPARVLRPASPTCKRAFAFDSEGRYSSILQPPA